MKLLAVIWADWVPLAPRVGSRGHRAWRLFLMLLSQSGVHALVVHRVAEAAHRLRLVPVWYVCRKVLYHWYHMDVWPSTDIGPGHWWPHPLGIVYSRHAVIGRRVKVYQNVQIISDPSGSPIIADFVNLFAGCCVAGGVRVGKGATVGTGAVVVHDVPNYAVVAGNPARVIRYRRADEIDNEDTEGLLSHGTSSAS